MRRKPDAEDQRIRFDQRGGDTERREGPRAKRRLAWATIRTAAHRRL